MLRNRDIAKQPVLTESLQALIQRTFTIEGDRATASEATITSRQVALLQFLSAALQVMPG